MAIGYTYDGGISFNGTAASFTWENVSLTSPGGSPSGTISTIGYGNSVTFSFNAGGSQFDGLHTVTSTGRVYYNKAASSVPTFYRSDQVTWYAPVDSNGTGPTTELFYDNGGVMEFAVDNSGNVSGYFQLIGGSRFAENPQIITGSLPSSVTFVEQ